MNEVLYKEIYDILHEEGITLIVVELPFVYEFYDRSVLEEDYGITFSQLDLGLIDNSFFSLSNNEGFYYVELYPYFEKNGGRDSFYEFDIHFNSNGHIVAANGVYEELLDKDLLPFSVL